MVFTLDVSIFFNCTIPIIHCPTVTIIPGIGNYFTGVFLPGGTGADRIMLSTIIATSGHHLHRVAQCWLKIDANGVKELLLRFSAVLLTV